MTPQGSELQPDAETIIKTKQRPHLAVNVVVVAGVRCRTGLLRLRLGRVEDITHHRPHLVVALHTSRVRWVDGCVSAMPAGWTAGMQGLHACPVSPTWAAAPAHAQARFNPCPPCVDAMQAPHLRRLDLQRQSPVVVLQGTLGQVLRTGRGLGNRQGYKATLGDASCHNLAARAVGRLTDTTRVPPSLRHQPKALLAPPPPPTCCTQGCWNICAMVSRCAGLATRIR